MAAMNWSKHAAQELATRARLASKSSARAHTRRLPDSYWLAEPFDGSARQRAPGRRVRSADRQWRTERRGRRRYGKRRDPGQRLHPRQRRPVLPDCAGPRQRRRQHRRRARSHHARRHGARQSARPRPARPGLCRPRLRGTADPVDNRRLESTDPLACPSLRAVPDDRRFGIAPSVTIAERASSRTTVVEVNARDRPALLAALTRRHPRLRLHRP